MSGTITAPAVTSPTYYEALCTVTTTGGRTKTAVSRFLVPVL